MSHRAESSSGSRATRRIGGGGSSQVRACAVTYPVGIETGLPLIPCPNCHLARVVELRVKQETVNKGRSFFKCPRNGNSKLCDFYKFQKEYLDVLVDKKIVRIMCEQLEELEEEIETADSEPVQDEGMKDLEKKMEKLTWKLNFFIAFAAIAVFAIVLKSCNDIM